MRKTTNVILGLPLMIAFCGFAPPSATRPASRPATAPATQPAIEKLVLEREIFALEVAATPAARELGLMNRDHIDPHGGMMFIYAAPQSMAFWMKNCPIEMDILFVDAKGVITATHRMLPAPPMRRGESESDYDGRLPRYESGKPAQFAIELKAGTVFRLNLRPGDRIDLDAPRLAKLATDDSAR